MSDQSAIDGARFAEVQHALLGALSEFRDVLAGPPAPDEQVQTWKIATPDGEWTGGVWCAEPDCGCSAENSEIGYFRESEFTLRNLHLAIGEHIERSVQRRAEEVDGD